MGRGTGLGKTILIGDQFVLEGVPAIVSSIPYETEAIVERIEGDGWILEDNRIEVRGYKEKKKGQQVVFDPTFPAPGTRWFMIVSYNGPGWTEDYAQIFFGQGQTIADDNASVHNVGSWTVRPVPEPTTMLLFGAGLVGLARFGRKKFKK